MRKVHCSKDCPYGLEVGKTTAIVKHMVWLVLICPNVLAKEDTGK